ncbi:MAG TPA: Rieske (2Fe-2S) protein [Stellaceae bacterium]|nr:Rieske (2Fe-2S) protein [Stellaceae bacterium]
MQDGGHQTTSRRRLCRAEEVPEGGARGFRFEQGADFMAVFVTRKGGELIAYDNSCPHMGTPLDVRPGRFITSDRRHLSCGTHGARFRFEDGYCLAGPCKGQSLRRLEIAVEAGEIVLLEEPKVQTPEAPA